MTMKNSTGFTLVETMVAVAILALAVSGPLFAASRALVAADISQGQLTASYLAQEGIEYVRAMRDDAYLHAYQANGSNVSQDAWTDFTTGSNSWSITPCTASACTLDPLRSSSQVAACSGAACDAPLYILSTGVYSMQNLSGAEVTPFSRTIQAFAVAGYPDDERIVSTVKWKFHGVPYVVTVTDNLTSWQ